MNRNEKKIFIMKNAPIPQALLNLGIPTMTGMLVSALYNVVDTYFVAGLGESQVGAVSVVFPISQIIMGLGLTFGSGGASYISRLLGMDKQERASQTASVAFVTSLLVGIGAILLSLIFLNPLLRGLGATDTILPHARGYAVIFLAGSILNIFNITLNNLVTAEGATKLSMLAMLLGGLLNCVLDPLFIYTFHLGVPGAAVATVISWSLTSLLYIVYLLRKRGVLRISLWPKGFKPDREMYREIFKVGIPTLVFQILSSLATSLTNVASSSYGDAAVAAMGIVSRIMTLSNYAVFGFLKGFQPLAGYNYGAKQYGRLKQAINISLLWSTAFCGITGLLFAFFAPSILSVFGSGNVQMIHIGSRTLRLNGIMSVFFGLEMVYPLSFLALGKGPEGSILSIGRQGLCFIPAILILPRLLGLNGVIFAQPAADILMVILTAFFAVKLHKRINALLAGE